MILGGVGGTSKVEGNFFEPARDLDISLAFQASA